MPGGGWQAVVGTIADKLQGGAEHWLELYMSYGDYIYSFPSLQKASPLLNMQQTQLTN
jgi:hypothetical protein